MGERGWGGAEAELGCAPPAPGHLMASPLWVSLGPALVGQEGTHSSMSQVTKLRLSCDLPKVACK